MQNGTHLALHVLSVVLPVDFARWRVAYNSKGSIADLSGQSILEVKKTGLTDVLNLRAGLADDGGLVSHTGTRIPAEDREGPGTCPT